MIRFWISKLRFSTSKQMKALLLKAVWADNIFNQIIITKDTPLVDHLLKYQLTQLQAQTLQKYEVNSIDIEESRIELMKKFDPHQGVKLPSSLLTMQKRIVQAANAQRRLAFYPNTFTTADIFRIESEIMLNGIKCKYMTTGHTGISKTMSYLLSWVLSSESISFRYLYPSQTIQLTNLNVLREKMSKIIYLSFKESEANFGYFTQIMLDQCPQIQKKVQNSVGQKIKQQMSDIDFSKVLDEIKKFYQKKGIQCLFIFDQVNNLTDRFKRAHQILRDSNSDQKNQGFFKETSALFHVYDNISSRFPKILNSSTIIQDQLLNQRSPLSPYSLDINRHTKTKMYNLHINYNQIKLKELYRFIWFETAKQIPYKHKKMNKIKKIIIKKCDQLAETEGFSSQITPLSIFNAFGVQKIEFSDFYQDIYLKFIDVAIEYYIHFLFSWIKIDFLTFMLFYQSKHQQRFIFRIYQCLIHKREQVQIYQKSKEIQQKVQIDVQGAKVQEQTVQAQKKIKQLNEQKLGLINKQKQ